MAHGRSICRLLSTESNKVSTIYSLAHDVLTDVCMSKFTPRRIAAIAGIAMIVSGCSTDSTTESGPEGIGGKADTIFTDGPLFITGAFDGSKKFQMWVETMKFARSVKERFGKSVGFTYFINSCYFDTEVSRSWIGKAHSRGEIIARWALVQQAINEGHEIGNHTVRHQDGTEWTRAQWDTELEEFHALTDNNLFKPVLDGAGQPVFPAWREVPGAASGEVGASCASSDECNSGLCIPLTPSQSFCTDTCNKNRSCASGTACGAPDWNSSVDYCIPLPEFPVVFGGEVLFDENGTPNQSHPSLQSYPIVGFRAPQLGHTATLFESLEGLGYTYDTSKILSPGPPSRVVHTGRLFTSLYEFALMKNPGSRTIPMDYNYKVNDATGDRMLADYQQSVVDAYQVRGRQPWNIGHHFALWKGGSYWHAMQDAIVFAAKGCPTATGEKRCADVAFPTFIELANHLDAKSDGFGDIFADPNADSRDDHEAVPVDCPCDEAH